MALAGAVRRFNFFLMNRSFLEKLEKNFASHEHFERPKSRTKAADLDFVVKHYAGDVKYNVTGPRVACLPALASC